MLSLCFCSKIHRVFQGSFNIQVSGQRFRNTDAAVSSLTSLPSRESQRIVSALQAQVCLSLPSQGA